MNRRMLFGSGTLRALALACLVLLAALFSAAPRSAFAQANPVANAQQLYDAGKFADALTTLQNALSSGAVTGTEAVGARELLARCQAKVGDVPAARKTWLGILRQDPQYRVDEVRTPPDEVAVFKQALKEFQAEQEQARQRVPASLSVFYGTGSGANENLGEYVAYGGGDKQYDPKPEFGMGVRFPLRPKLSLDIEVQRFHATNEDSFPGTQKSTYQASALPVVFSLVYTLHERGKMRASIFAGGGPMLGSYVSDKFLFFGILPLQITDTKVGLYLGAGLEAEYQLHPKLSITGRALVRSAKATGMYPGYDFTQYSTGSIGDRDLDFSGYGLHLGLRGYIGY
jgi:hypothetical protein